MDENCPVVNIYRETEGLITFKTGDKHTYDACYDGAGDFWLITSDHDDFFDVARVRSEDGAVQYILEHIGVIEEGEYVGATA